MKKTHYFYAFLAILNIGCNQNANEATADAPAAAMMVSLPDRKDNADVSVEEESAASVEHLVAPESKPSIETKIIREADLKFQSDNLDTTYIKIANAVKKYGAIVQSDSQGNEDYAQTREISVRVPSKSFDAFIADVSQGVGNFDRKDISARDVTEEFIDTDARLKSKKALELRYLELLKKASKVSEMLEIEKHLSEAREDIESTEGQLKYLQSRVSMSVVRLSFYKQVARQNGVTVSYGSKMWNALAEGFYGISGFFLGLLYIWPIILILVALIFLVRKRLRRKKNL